MLDIMAPALPCIVSSSLRPASLTAATIRSSSIEGSLGSMASGSIFTETSCLWPLSRTVTMPPPTLVSTIVSASSRWRRSCISWACFINWRMLLISSILRVISVLFDDFDPAALEDLQDGLDGGLDARRPRRFRLRGGGLRRGAALPGFESRPRPPDRCRRLLQDRTICLQPRAEVAVPAGDQD